MRHSSEEEFRSLGVLIENGQIEQLGQRLLVLWPPNAEWDHEDVQFLAGLLPALKEYFGEKADPIYYAYAERLKSHHDNREWLKTLLIRSEVVKRYEGSDATIAWLEALRPQMTSGLSVRSPDDGYIDLLVGHMLREKGMLTDAREHLLRAAWLAMPNSAAGEWYLLETLNEAALCLAQLGEARLAFEYARAFCIQSLIRGHIKVQDLDHLYQQVYDIAMIFGQIEFMLELKRNLTHNACANGDFAWATQHESDASLCLAMIGVRDEAVAGLDRAANYAMQGSPRSSQYFSVICHLLARYLDQTPLTDDELDRLWNEAARVIQTPSVRHTLSVMQEKVRKHIPPDTPLLEHWRSLCEQSPLAQAKSADGTYSREICNHLSALLGRYYLERQNKALAMRFLEVVALQESVEAICSFVRMDNADRLIRAGKTQQVLKICQLALARNFQGIHERFFFAQLAARSCLALGWDQQAFAYAKRALSDWRRILDGLFAEEHKTVWLERGASVISCLMEILVGPLPWLSEEERHREIFEIIELGKARLMTDMVSHSGYVSGVYLFQEVVENPTVFVQMASFEGSGWEVPIMLLTFWLMPNVLVVDNPSDSGGREISYIDPTPLRSAFQLPRSSEKNLYTTAQSLPFEKRTQPPDSSLYDDLVQVMTPQSEES